jgi:hypothetical protein
VRKTPALLSALATAAIVVTALTGCSSAATGPFRSGDASSVVHVTGSTSKVAKATFPTPLVAKTSQVTQDTAGHGDPIRSGDQVDFEYSVFSGKTGELLGSSGYGASGSTVPRVAVVSEVGGKPTHSLVASLQGARTGERYTLVTTAKAGFGAGTLTSNGISNSDTLVVVVDVKDHFIGKANGANVLPQDGLPSVITAVNGQPGIVLQELAKPTTLRIETVKAGTGAVVKKNQTVRVKYSGWIWPAAGGDLAQPWDDTTWSNDEAADLPVKPTSAGGSIPTGLYQALIGAKVGSQVLAVIPPKDGFASGAVSAIPDGSTIIMVIDVLGIK